MYPRQLAHEDSVQFVDSLQRIEALMYIHIEIYRHLKNMYDSANLCLNLQPLLLAAGGSLPLNPSG